MKKETPTAAGYSGGSIIQLFLWKNILLRFTLKVGLIRLLLR